MIHAGEICLSRPAASGGAGGEKGGAHDQMDQMDGFFFCERVEEMPLQGVAFLRESTKARNGTRIIISRCRCLRARDRSGSLDPPGPRKKFAARTVYPVSFLLSGVGFASVAEHSSERHKQLLHATDGTKRVAEEFIPARG